LDWRRLVRCAHYLRLPGEDEDVRSEPRAMAATHDRPTIEGGASGGYSADHL